MKDGHYTILHITHSKFPGQEIGSFDIIKGELKNREGMAEDVLSDGPIDGRKEFDIIRLNNGYREVKWTRLTADLEENPPVHRSKVTSV